MHVISRKALARFAAIHPDAEPALDIWYRMVRGSRWKNLAELRKVLPHADFVDRFTVFNIKGNKYRLVSEINYRRQVVFVRHVLTHKKYDREAWKK